MSVRTHNCPRNRYLRQAEAHRRVPRGAQKPDCAYTARDKGAGRRAERSREHRPVFALPPAFGPPLPERSSARLWTRSSFCPSDPTCRPGHSGLLVRSEQEEEVITDAQITTTLRDAGLGSIQVRAGGLDTEHDWSAILSLGGQQLLALTRLTFARPAFAVLDRVTASLKPAQVREALRRLDENSVTFIVFAEDAESIELYDAVLQIDGDGGWTWNRISRAA
jgi:hypothetical protein